MQLASEAGRAICCCLQLLSPRAPGCPAEDLRALRSGASDAGQHGVIEIDACASQPPGVKPSFGIDLAGGCEPLRSLISRDHCGAALLVED